MILLDNQVTFEVVSGYAAEGDSFCQKPKSTLMRESKRLIMAKKKSDNSGLMSSAGLMRYFEADDTAIKLDPKMVVGVCVASGIVVLGLNIAFRLWP
jgi:preprotein translocase subunit Sec61beta